VYLDPTADERSSAASAAVAAVATPKAPAEALVSLIQTTIATVLGPLVAELAANRQLERDHGRQTAELERAASTIVALSAGRRSRRG
jgi:hypothetical protein